MTKKKTAKTSKRTPKKASGSSYVRPIIVKRQAHAEHYDERKVYASAYFACRNAHMGEREAEKIAEKVTLAVNNVVKKERIILSDVIFASITRELRKHSDDAAFLFETHRDLN